MHGGVMDVDEMQWTNLMRCEIRGTAGRQAIFD
jgi:hypothetical protein